MMPFAVVTTLIEVIVEVKVKRRDGEEQNLGMAAKEDVLIDQTGGSRAETLENDHGAHKP